MSNNYYLYKIYSVIILFFTINSIFAQKNNFTFLGKNLYELQQATPTYTLPSFYFFKKENIKNNIPTSCSSINIPRYYNYQNLAFFCKVEVKLEQKCQVPIKFRLGDVNYVDWLEQK